MNRLLTRLVKDRHDVHWTVDALGKWEHPSMTVMNRAYDVMEHFVTELSFLGAAFDAVVEQFVKENSGKDVAFGCNGTCCEGASMCL